MQALINHIRTFPKNEDGPTVTEYAIMLAVIVCVALLTIRALGDKVDGICTVIGSALGVGG